MGARTTAFASIGLSSAKEVKYHMVAHRRPEFQETVCTPPEQLQ